MSEPETMDGFFHGWRRKIGVTTLVMACLVTGVWLGTLDDMVSFPSLTLMLDTSEGDLRMRGQLWLAPLMNGDEFCWNIPYWSIVIPLTLISVYFLLSKPRTKPIVNSQAPSSP